MQLLDAYAPDVSDVMPKPQPSSAPTDSQMQALHDAAPPQYTDASWAGQNADYTGGMSTQPGQPATIAFNQPGTGGAINWPTGVPLGQANLPPSGPSYGGPNDFRPLELVPPTLEEAQQQPSSIPQPVSLPGAPFINAIGSIPGAINEATDKLGQGATYAARHIPLTPGIPGVTPQLTTGDVLNALPANVGPVPVKAPVNTAFNFGAQTAPYVAADIASGGTLTPAYAGMAASQAGQVGQAYAAGQISGKQALVQLALAAGPMAVPGLLHAAGPVARALADLADSDTGQTILRAAQSERGGGPPEGPGLFESDVPHEETPAGAAGLPETPQGPQEGAQPPQEPQTVYQPTQHLPTLVGRSVAEEPAVDQAVRQAVADISGAHMDTVGGDSALGTDVKATNPEGQGMPRIVEKADERTPAGVSDYLRTRIAVDTPMDMQQTIANLRQHFDVLQEDNKLVSDPEQPGYHAYHMQLQAPDGKLSFEAQIVPTPVAQIQEGAMRDFYDKWRDVPPAERGADFTKEAAPVQQAGDAAYQNWLGGQTPDVRAGGAGQSPPAPAPPTEPPDIRDVVPRVQQAIAEARRLSPEQQAMISEQKGQRVAIAAQRLQQGSGLEGFWKSKGALAGEYQKPTFAPLDIAPEDVNAVVDHISARGLQYFQKLGAITALEKMTLGIKPADSELTLLEKAVPQLRARDALAKAQMAGSVRGISSAEDIAPATGQQGALLPPPPPATTSRLAAAAGGAARGAAELTNSVRTILTIFPLHGIFRQGGVDLFRHPLIVGNLIRPQLEAWMSEDFARAFQKGIDEAPDAYRPVSRMAEGPPGYNTPEIALHMPDVFGHDPITAREPETMSNVFDKLGIVGKPAAMGKRSYNVFVKGLRAGDYQSEAWEAWNNGARDLSTYQNLARTVEHRTGWGGVERFGTISAGANVAINPFFSAQRLVAAIRYPLDVLNSDPYARMSAAKALTAQVVGMTTALGIASYFVPGATAGLNAWASDFGKMRVGNISYDFTGGEGGIVRLIAQMIGNGTDARQSRMTTTGPQTFDASRLGIIKTFLTGRENPAFGLGAEVVGGKQQITGKPVNLRTTLYDRLTPIFAHDLVEAARLEGAKGIASVFVPALGGAGVGAYDRPAADVFNARDQASKALGLTSYTDPKMTDAQRAQIDNNPAVQSAVNSYQQGLTGSAATVLQNQQASDAQYQKDGNASAWRDRLHALQTAQGIMNAGRGDVSTGDPVKDNYYAIFRNPAYVVNGQTIDSAGLSDAIDQYRASLQPAQLEDLDNATGTGATLTPMEREYHADLHTIEKSGYYGVRDWAAQQIGQQYGYNFQTYGDLIAAIQKEATANNARVQDAQAYQQAQTLITQGKDYFRENNPQIDALLVEWGMASKPRTQAAADIIKHDMGTNVPVAQQ